MSGNLGNQPRVKVDGKFFRLGENKFFPKGVCYGPFAPDRDGICYPSREQSQKDLELIRQLGANVIRVYDIPPRWFVDLAYEFGVKLLIDIPWETHICFLDYPLAQARAREAVRSAVKAFAGHPAIFAYSVANEIKPDIARWSGAKNIEDFINSLVEEAKTIDPECLCTFGNFPPTEYLSPSGIDFFCFNVYLHQKKPLENYLSRLQMLSAEKPIIIGEFGFDSLRLGEDKKCELFGWQIRTIFESGFAGAIIFSFTDDWFRGGQKITDWQMGLTTEDRQPKKSFHIVQEEFKIAPYYPLPRYPKISVVVACYNGARTLKACLDSLFKLNYPDYEVILIDDGSTDATPQIAKLYKDLRYFRQQNHGLSVARNTGIAMATGEIVAFTDADCRADEDWLYYLTMDLLRSDFVGMGGPNLLPPEDSPVAAVVMASPGGPAHVMLTDRIAEHVPGCNMAFYKWVLDEIEGFDPIFRKAGDDVDICWRIQEKGYKIGFSPSAFVWHYRRSSVRDYLKQQYGYGEAEALLIRKHPEYFNTIGGSVWSGRIYTPAKPGLVAGKRIIYHGQFGSAMFQTLYTPAPITVFGLMTSFEYHMLITLPLLILSAPFRFLFPFAIINLLLVSGFCLASGIQSEIPKNKRRFWSKPLVGLLYFLQPIVRGYARYHRRLLFNPMPMASTARLEWAVKSGSEEPPGVLNFWVESNMNRIGFLEVVQRALDREGWSYRVDSGWNKYDIEIFGSRWSNIQLTTVSEPYAGGKQVLKCKLETSSSLPAKVVFCTVFAIEFLLIGLFGRHTAWAWMILITLPVILWYFSSEQKILKNIMIHFLSEVAEGCKFKVLEEIPDSEVRYKPVQK